MLSIAVASLLSSAAFAPALRLDARTPPARAGAPHMSAPACSRRASLAAAAALFSLPLSACAADVKDLGRLKKGLEGIQYLLDNWVVETTNPTSGNADPDRVRLYLGLRTTDHPLFQVEKLLAKAQDRISDDDFERWVEASEGWNSHVNKINELAYTSSFGEYNPGGGKDQVAKYLQLAKEEVELSR